jgi:hypothetical protein
VRIGEKRRASDFTKSEIKFAHKQKIIALHFIDSYFARTLETTSRFAEQ